ncbi:hypothetical protein NPX13_g7741 [Xylaria arbuscula]|uniref:Uncharacterized protein n=1 Tax=Xylaria arbuscula TaxID=114810 RepID=A0A9W8TKH5_9PEZI|nr:hypothetical protein NPX13_g7741 [Xylaria arbuscula]
MSARVTGERKPPSLEEIDRLRDELRSLSLKGVSDLDEDTIEEILALPPTLFLEALQHLRVSFGPLSALPSPQHSNGAVTSGDPQPSRRPNPVLDDGASSLDDALVALDGYNRLLEEKIAKFNVQSTRSFTTSKETPESDHDIRAINEMINEIRLRKLHHMQEIEAIEQTLDSYDKIHSPAKEEYTTAFWREILFLNSHESFSDKHNVPPSTDASVWNEYDYVLQHIQRWGDLVDIDSSNVGEATINRAAQLVNGLVYVITRRCQAQLATVFHENLTHSTSHSGHQKAAFGEAADIIRDIDELWEEVAPVADMSISAQFLRPIFTLYNDWESSKNSRTDIVTTYASGVLKFMNDRLSVVAERAKALVHHQRALHDVALLRQRAEISGAALEYAPQTKAQKLPLVSKNATAAEDIRAIMQLYGVVPVHADDPYSIPTPSMLDESSKKGAKSTLTDRELGGELLLESLLADSAAHPMKAGSVYKDTQLEGSIEMLRDQIEQIENMFNDMHIGVPESAPDYVARAYRQISNQLKGKGSLKTDCSKLEEFTQKWSR